MKKFLSLVSSLILLGTCAFGLSACWSNDKVGDTETHDGLLYTLVKNPKGGMGYTVSGISDTVKDAYIPTFIRNNRPVIAIEENAFYGYTQLESISIPYYVTEVGANAFAGCVNLKSVHIEKAEVIGANAFARCENLESVSALSVESWCNISFANMASNPMYFATEFCVGGKPVEDLVVPFNATQVPDFAFYECENIKSVTIEGARSIGQSAFYGCGQLESIKINGNLLKMGELAFADCPSLKTVEFGRQVEVIGEYAFLRCASIEELTVPASVKRIEASAFSDCTAIKTLNLKEGLEYIGDCAFGGCVSLAEFKMPSTVSSIGFGIVMFGGNAGFVTGDTSNQVDKITLSDKLTEIPDFSFSFCGIKTVTIGEKVTRISYSAFYGCDQLESVVLPKSLKNIISFAFYRCTALNTVYYKGTAEEWASVKIGKSGNDNFTGANDTVPAEVYFYSATRPEQDGNYWRYVNGEPTKW
ncbi:MAG: leucine-rich repeat domain-containing protein [Clostridia bacterium]|nr:leucine-rich repeat domain-containing protein [Clostridia bacterium]